MNAATSRRKGIPMSKVYRMCREPDAHGRVRWRRRLDSGPGRWFLDYVDHTGRRVREATSATTKTEAQNLLRARLSESTRADILGLPPEALKPVPFDVFFRETYLPASATRVKGSTQERKLQLGRHLLEYFGSTPLRTINAGRVQEFITARRGVEPKPSASEVNRERALLSNVFEEAFRRELVDANPVRRVRPLKERNARDLWLRPEDVDAVLELAEPFVRPFVLMAVHTGLRLGELAELRWEDLEHSPGFVRVSEQSKGGRPRFIPLNSAAREVLEGLPHHVGPEGAVPWVFFNARRRNAYRANSVYHGFRRAAEGAAEILEAKKRSEAAGRLRRSTFHTLRHSFASWTIQAGVPIAEVQQYLGHASDVMTRRYAHLACPTLKRNSLEVLVQGDGRNPADEVASHAGAV